MTAHPLTLRTASCAVRPLCFRQWPPIMTRPDDMLDAGRCVLLLDHRLACSPLAVGKRCFVSNLAWKTSWQDLKDKFREVGNVVYANVHQTDDGALPALTSQLW